MMDYQNQPKQMEKPTEEKKISRLTILFIVGTFFAFLILLALIFIIIAYFVKCSEKEVDQKGE